MTRLINKWTLKREIEQIGAAHNNGTSERGEYEESPGIAEMQRIRNILPNDL